MSSAIGRFILGEFVLHFSLSEVNLGCGNKQELPMVFWAVYSILRNLLNHQKMREQGHEKL